MKENENEGHQARLYAGECPQVLAYVKSTWNAPRPSPLRCDSSS